MKNILTLITGLLLACATLSAQNTVYIVDSNPIDNFDGSVLKGKTIKDYKITTSGRGKNAVTIHSITTMSPYTVNGNFFGTALIDSLSKNVMKIKMMTDSIENKAIALPRKTTYIVDGKKVADLNNIDIPSNRVKSVSVIKESGNKDIIIIDTKKEDAELAEFLKSIPGINIAADGKMTINGEPIKKITINGHSYSVK